VLAVLAALLLAGTVQAGGIILEARPPGEAGIQLDAALISPELPRPEGGAPVPRDYVVQTGDTLGAIAVRFGVPVAALASENGIARPDRIEVGQALRIDDAAPPAPTLPPDGAFGRLQLWPWPPAQGQTLIVWMQSQSPVTFSLTFGEQEHPVVTDGRKGWAFVPIPALAAPGPAPMYLTAGDSQVTLDVPVQAGVFETEEIPASASDPILSEAGKVNAELDRMTTLFAAETPSGWTPRSRFAGPLTGLGQFPRTAPFGSRRTYGDSPALSFHAGEDFAAPPGTPVLAPAGGVVVLADPLFVRGNAVVIDHGHGVFSGYWHMSKLDVKPGDVVEPGQQLGEVGTTGLSTGAHLHWELRVDGIAVDPLQWLEP
jgi:murein DD-endopeptidase MepM/ murein hydrolase activator NlpD